MIKKQFEKFILSLKDKELNSYEKSVIRLIYDNFNDIKILSKGGGKRGKKISEIIYSNLEKKILGLPDITESESISKILSEQKKIGNLKVSYFRGFQEEQEFNFCDNLNIVYGRNGYGKSSFSEALEYGLTIDIKESNSRGFRNLNQYIKNIHSDKNHILKLVDKDGIKIESNIEQFRYNLIEKNRIDFFVNSKNKSDSDLLDNLFGYGEFNDFCDDFPQTLSQLLIKYSHLKLQGELEGHENGITQTESNYIIIKNNFQESISENQLEYEINNDFNLSKFNKLIESKISEFDKIFQEKGKVEESNMELNNKIDTENKNLTKIKKYLKNILIITIILAVVFSILNPFISFFIIVIGIIFHYTQNNKRLKIENNIIQLNKGIKKIDQINLDETSLKKGELNKLKTEGNDFNIKLTNLKERRTQREKFKKENKRKLNEIEGNNQYNKKINGYQSGYTKFKLLLDGFSHNLSQGEMKIGIEEKTKEIFNLLSQYKDNKIVIENIHLPKKQRG